MTGRVLLQLDLFAAFFGVVAFWILWENGYRRRWTQFRARNWRSVSGKFNEGEIVPVMRGRSAVGYGVRLGYNCQAAGPQIGIYTLPFHAIFSMEREAEGCRQLVANRDIPVRISPRNSKRSVILDKDLKPLLPRRAD